MGWPDRDYARDTPKERDSMLERRVGDLPGGSSYDVVPGRRSPSRVRWRSQRSSPGITPSFRFTWDFRIRVLLLLVECCRCNFLL